MFRNDVTGPATFGVVVMGVSGSGKSTLGAMLAQSLNCSFLEGDSYHAPGSIEKMRAGQPLEDHDRWPWLDRLGLAMADSARREGVSVAACSALKRGYRARLSRALGMPLAFVLLSAPSDELLKRLQQRPGHYMPPSLLQSQLATLEMPGEEEPVLPLDSTQPPDQLLNAAREWLENRHTLIRA